LTSAGTHQALAKAGIKSQRLPKLAAGRPNIIDLMKNGEIRLIINTPTRKGPQTDEGKIRAAAVTNRVPIITTITGGRVAVGAIRALRSGGWNVKPLQEYAQTRR
jgi:carbamoyl-phosphate synthase large subunit